MLVLIGTIVNIESKRTQIMKVITLIINKKITLSVNIYPTQISKTSIHYKKYTGLEFIFQN